MNWLLLRLPVISFDESNLIFIMGEWGMMDASSSSLQGGCVQLWYNGYLNC